MVNKKFSVFYMVFAAFFLMAINKITQITKSHETFSQIINRVSIYTIFFLLGVILSIDYLYNQKIKEGKWKINFPKLVLVALPCLILILARSLWYLGIYSLPEYLASSTDVFYYAISTISGYMLFACFYKQKI